MTIRSSTKTLLLLLTIVLTVLFGRISLTPDLAEIVDDPEERDDDDFEDFDEEYDDDDDFEDYDDLDDDFEDYDDLNDAFDDDAFDDDYDEDDF